MTLPAEALTLSVMVLSLALSAWAKGRADAIKDFRTHLGDAGDGSGRRGHPYRDYWHAMDHARTFADFIAGGCLALGVVLGSWPVYIIAVAVVVPLYKRLIFDFEYYMDPEGLYNLDEKTTISTGSKRLDKFFGYHH